MEGVWAPHRLYNSLSFVRLHHTILNVTILSQKDKMNLRIISLVISPTIYWFFAIFRQFSDEISLEKSLHRTFEKYGGGMLFCAF
jgi:hypothetical protein